MSAYIYFNISLQQINNHNIYNINNTYDYEKSFAEDVKQ